MDNFREYILYFWINHQAVPQAFFYLIDLIIKLLIVNNLIILFNSIVIHSNNLI